MTKPVSKRDTLSVAKAMYGMFLRYGFTTGKYGLYACRVCEPREDQYYVLVEGSGVVHRHPVRKSWS